MEEFHVRNRRTRRIAGLSVVADKCEPAGAGMALNLKFWARHPHRLGLATGRQAFSPRSTEQSKMPDTTMPARATTLRWLGRRSARRLIVKMGQTHLREADHERSAPAVPEASGLAAQPRDPAAQSRRVCQRDRPATAPASLTRRQAWTGRPARSREGRVARCGAGRPSEKGGHRRSSGKVSLAPRT